MKQHHNEAVCLTGKVILPANQEDLPKALLGPLVALTTPLRAQLIAALKSKEFDRNESRPAIRQKLTTSYIFDQAR